MSKKTFAGFCLCFFLLSGVFLWLLCIRDRMFDSGGSFYFLNGPVGEAFSPIETLRWLFIFTPVWAGCGWLVDMETRNARIFLYRYKQLRRWWLRLPAMVYGVNVLYFALLLGLYSLSIRAVPAAAVLLRVAVIFFHSLAMTAAMLLLHMLAGSVIFAWIALVVLETVSKVFVLLGLPPALVPLVWGMYGYGRDLYGPGGFFLPTAIGLAVAFGLLAVVLPLICKKMILRSVKL